MSDSEESHQSDDEEEGDEEEEERHARPKRRNDDDDDDDDDDDSDDEEDEDDEFSQPAPKKRGRGSSGGRSKGKKAAKKKPRFDMSMYDDEAAEDGADEEEDEGDDHERASEAELTALEREAHERVRRRQEQQNSKWSQKSAAEIAQELEERYKGSRGGLTGLGRGGHMSDEEEDEGGDYEPRVGRGRRAGISADMAQQAEQPTVTDPKLFMLKVKTGKEQVVVWQVMNKATLALVANKPFGVFSAVCTGAKGYVYLEGRSSVEVLSAIEHIQFVYRNKMAIVPIKEMTAAIAPKTKVRPLKEGQLVRISRGIYKDDLAKVEWVLESGSKAVVKYIPRLDLSAGVEGSKAALSAASQKAKTSRPSQRFFHPDEVKAIGGAVERRKFPSNNEWMDYYNGNFYQNGFVRKEVNVSTMIRATGVNPSVEELQKFRSRDLPGGEGMDRLSDDEEGEGGGADKEGGASGHGAGALSKAAKASADRLMEELAQAQDKEDGDGRGGIGKQAALFARGDVVLVTQGDVKDLMGRVVEVRHAGGDVTVRVQPLAEALKDEIVEVLPKELMKFMRVGAHARVIDGQFLGETGTIVDVHTSDGDSTAVLLTDSAKEIQVRVAQLQETMDVAQGVDSLAGYELYDLVQYGQNDFGLIVVVGREDFNVLSSTGQQRTVKPEELRGKRNEQSNRSVALDAEQNQVRVGDVVNVIDGKFARQSGTVKALHKYTLFLHSRTVQQHSGIFTARARSCVLGGNRRTAVQQQMSMTYMGQVGPNGAGPNGGAGGGGGGKNDRRNRHDELLNKTVKLIKGTFKGHMGVVTEATATHVRVELSTKMKKVYIERDKVKQVGDQLGGFDATSNPFAPQPGGLAAIGDLMAPPTPFLTAATPLHGAATPMHGNMTPMHGSMTPMHGNQTPLHGSMTPMHDGSMTPHRTPSHDIWRPGVGDTPARPSGGNFDDDWGDRGRNGAGGSNNMDGYDGGGGGGSSSAYGNNGWESSRGGWRSGSSVRNDGSASDGGRSSRGRDFSDHSRGDNGGGGETGSYRGGLDSASPMSTSTDMSTTSGRGGRGGGAPLWAQRGAVVSGAGFDDAVIVTTKGGEGAYGGYESGARVIVRMDGGKGEEREYAVDEVRPVVPGKGSRIRVVSGEHVGREGRFKNMEGDDAVCKLKGTDGIVILAVNSLIKLE